MTYFRHLFLLSLASALSGCGKEPVPEAPARPVRSMLVTGGESGESATYTAEIRSRFETDLSFQVPGKVVRRDVDLGTTVATGQVLAPHDLARVRRRSGPGACARFRRRRTR